MNKQIKTLIYFNLIIWSISLALFFSANFLHINKKQENIPSHGVCLTYKKTLELEKSGVRFTINDIQVQNIER